VHSDVVDDIQITTGMFAIGQNVAYEGYALDPNGDPIPLAALDSGEVRAEAANPRVRANPTKVETIPGVPGGFRAIHERSAGYGAFVGETETLDHRRNALLTFGDPAMGYGHIAPPPPFAQLVEGISARQLDGIPGGGPALGCPATTFERNSIETTSPTAINAANAGSAIVVNGRAASDVTVGEDVEILVDGAVRDDAVVTVTPGTREWTATIPAAAIPATDAPLKIEADFPNSAFDTIAGAYISTIAVPKDVTAPVAPGASLASGTYVGAQAVTLTAEAGATIRYTNNGAEPTPTSSVANGPIAITATQTLKAIAIDAAGNPSPVTVREYTITSPPGPGAGDGGGGGAAGLTLGTTVGAAAGASDTARGSAAKAKLGITALIASKSIKRRKARIQGLRLTLRLVPGTEVVRLRIYRRLRNGARVLLSSGFRAPAAAGFYRVTLKDPALRRKLTAGNYEIEVTPGASRTDLGNSRRHTFKVTRR